ncbi:hypothetical protein GPALN_006582 [Globodera pallida]|nr:hypothetical protein GPALN_006582 [Globodera pallida]
MSANYYQTLGEIDEAYKILTDIMLKRIYDRHGHVAVHAYREQRQRRASSEVITLDDTEDERVCPGDLLILFIRILSAANTPTTSTIAFTVPFPDPNTTTSTVTYTFRYTVTFTSTVAFIFPIADKHTACRLKNGLIAVLDRYPSSETRDIGFAKQASGAQRTKAVRTLEAFKKDEGLLE